MLFTVTLRALGGIGAGLALRTALCVGLGSGLAGCGGSEHPPPPAESHASNASSADGGPYFDGLGPDLPPSALGDCGATVVELEVVRPNLYFLLDGSGSMTQSMPGLVFQNRFDSARIAIELVLRTIGHRVNFGASVFPEDPAGCGPGWEVHETAPGDPVSYAVANESGPQLKRLAFNLMKISPDGVTPTAIALSKLHDTLTGLPGQTFLFLLTDGAPNCNASVQCERDQCTLNVEQVRISETEICDESLNCCSPNLFGSTACLDAQATIDAVAALHDDGVDTFVVGMPGTETYASLLDDLAHAGGLARSQAPYYYPVTDSEELAETLHLLGGEASLSCRIDLNEVPPDPDLVNVFLDDALIPFDPEEGWSWDGEGTVELHGEPCDLATGGQVLQIQIVAGCPVFLR